MSGGSVPSAKKARTADETRNDEPTSSGGASNSFSRDGARKAALVFQIDDFNAFKTSTERLEGEKVSLGGFQWHIRCYVTDGMLSLVLVATHPTQPVWHCKAEFGLRAETDRDYYSKSTEIFANTCPAWGWVKLASVYVSRCSP
ncbi:hypothetical protein AAVH_22934 [Aphelenchoides avenae]|nr:hypothetical protein AAVH_22934 [Aphelenchus avenae]